MWIWSSKVSSEKWEDRDKHVMNYEGRTIEIWNIDNPLSEEAAVSAGAILHANVVIMTDHWPHSTLSHQSIVTLSHCHIVTIVHTLLIHILPLKISRVPSRCGFLLHHHQVSHSKRLLGAGPSVVSGKDDEEGWKHVLREQHEKVWEYL